MFVAGFLAEAERRLALRMRLNGPALRFSFVVETMSAAVAHVAENFPGAAIFLDRDHLDAHRPRLLAFKATDHLGEIDHLDDGGILGRYFSNQFAHGLFPDRLT